VEIGIDSFVAAVPDSLTGANLSPQDRISHLLEEIQLADEVGLDVFGIGEHHRAEFLDSAPETLLAAAAALTQQIRLTSAVTVLSAHDPVRLFQQFATIDLISRGRTEMIVGRGAGTEAFPLFGLELKNYDALFAEKLELLLKLRENARIHWAGRFRPPLQGQPVYPRPVQEKLPIWLGVGGTAASFARAGELGLPLMVAIIGGQPHRFKPLIELYRQAGEEVGHQPGSLRVGIHALGYVADTDQQAADEFFPGYAQSFTDIGKERGWGPVTRSQYEAVRGASGAMLVSDPERVAEKIIAFDEVLRGISRLTFQMSIASLPHSNRMRAIELLGTKVAPLVRGEIKREVLVS
jgi:probable LLM family oxidoreductase